MSNIVKQVIEQLECWKSCFLQDGSCFDVNIDGISIELDQLTDQIENISQDGQDCYASYLFSQLNNDNKEQILSEIDFDVNFDELYCTYYR